MNFDGVKVEIEYLEGRFPTENQLTEKLLNEMKEIAFKQAASDMCKKNGEFDYYTAKGAYNIILSLISHKKLIIKPNTDINAGVAILGRINEFQKLLFEGKNAKGRSSRSIALKILQYVGQYVGVKIDREEIDREEIDREEIDRVIQECAENLCLKNGQFHYETVMATSFLKRTENSFEKPSFREFEKSDEFKKLMEVFESNFDGVKVKIENSKERFPVYTENQLTEKLLKEMKKIGFKQAASDLCIKNGKFALNRAETAFRILWQIIEQQDYSIDEDSYIDDDVISAVTGKIEEFRILLSVSGERIQSIASKILKYVEVEIDRYEFTENVCSKCGNPLTSELLAQYSSLL